MSSYFIPNTLSIHKISLIQWRILWIPVELSLDICVSVAKLWPPWYSIIFTELKWGAVLKLLWCLNRVYRQGWGPRGELHRARGSYSTERRWANTLSDFPSAMHASGMPRETHFKYIHMLTSRKKLDGRSEA